MTDAMATFHTNAVTTLHITNGDSVRGTLQRFVSGPVAITADPLHEGPAPAEVEGDAWRALRARFLADGSIDSYDDAYRTLTEWDAAIADASKYDEVVLWFEHDLFDQLLLIRTLDLLVRLTADTTDEGAGPHDVADPHDLADSHGAGDSYVVSGGGRTRVAPRVSLICIGGFPGVERFVGLGQLNADQLASLADRRQPVTAQHYTLAQGAWAAFRSPDPTHLLRLTVRLKADTTYEFLGDALRRFLEEYPSTRNGLSRSADAILQALITAPLSAHDLFVRTQAAEPRPFMGDTMFFRIAHHLASTRVPLVNIEEPAGVEPGALDLARARMSLTDAGREVAAGRQDAVAVNGIDEWRGGVHLWGLNSSPWRWDPAAETLVS
jgi:hypothetical protein